MEVTASNTVPRSLQFDEDDFPSASSLYPNSTLVFAWGRGDYGQLGLGDDAGRDFPTCIQSLSDKSIVHVSGNDFHTAFLTGEGDLFMAGNNDSGQLGVRSRESQLSSMRVSSLDIYRISHVACGQAHTVAVTDMGAVVSWGASEFGQLGHKDAIDVVDVIQPRIVKGTRDLHFVRVACGAAHTLALTGSGEVYSFGQGLYGALGLGSIESTSSPTLVNDLWGLGIIQITCGENHSAALSVDGQVFTWGRGKYGQLGHGTLQNELRPLPVKLLADQMIVQLICGGNHTMAINEEGMLFSWGQGHWGQTGLGVVEDTLLPTQVHCLQGLRIIQASAGSRHSIAVTDDGKVYGWGDGEQNQLGFTTNKIQMLPSLLSFPVKEGLQLLYALAAGEHTIAVFCHLQRDQLRFSGPSNLDCSKHDVVAFELNKGDIFGTDLWSHGYQIAEQELVLSEENDPCILPGDSYVDIPGSGFKPMIIPYLPKLLEEGNCSLRSLAILVQSIEDIFSSIRFLTLSFKLHPSRWFGKGILKARSLMETDSDGPGLDTLLIRDVYQKILELYRPEILNKLVGSLIRCLEGIEKHKYDVSDSRWTRVLLIALQCPLVGEKGPGDALSTKLFTIFERISPSVRSTMVQWFKTYPKEVLGGRLVRGVQKYISSRKHLLSTQGGMSGDVVAAVKVLSILNEANKVSHLIPYTEFYNLAVSDNNMPEFWQEEFMKWIDVSSGKATSELISFCQVPFLLTPKAKSQILQVEADIQKQLSVQKSVFQHTVLHSSSSPFLILKVHRSDLISDTLQQLSSSCPDEFKKPLKVIFDGEDGVDEGGVRKEFFQILVHDLFNVAYGMFTYNEEMRNFWFNPNSIDSEHEFWLVGIIFGLAIYNGAILDVHFPKVAYKKMMGLRPSLDDLKDFRPDIAKGLQLLLEFSSDVAETFYLFFQITYDYFGELHTHDLIPNGCDTPVTNQNRQRYVDLYVKYLLVDSIDKQFSAFSKGFQQVCGGQALQLFHYDELELLISGLPHYDFDALERVTVYDGGYTKESELIVWFWELVREMSLEEKKALLFFTTGNDRAPVGGLGSLQIVIIKHGGDTDRLPTAQTCFNVLMLPEYCSKSKLENRLKLAISNSTGFGLQ